MPLPITRSALDKLGKRLASGEANSDDWTLFEDVLGCYQKALDDTNDRLRSLGLHPTGRTKSTATLLDKLSRGTSLKSLQDLAGTRIVCEEGRARQDEITAMVVREFTVDGKPPRFKDRRQEPMHGYRAVHVTVTVDGMPVEVQIRTLLQHLWAEVTEALGDRWGRGLRYHETFAGYDLPLEVSGPTAPAFTRGSFMVFWRELADSTATLEELERFPGHREAEVMAIKAQLHEALNHVRDIADEM